MRTLGILTLLTLLCGNIMSQDADICNDLFISEILYGYHEDSVATVSTYETKSYAVEIFNPTDNSINLSDYKIELVDNDDQVANTTFNLSGTIDSAETFVITNTDADVAVTSKADYTHDDFKFDSFVQVQLTKNSVILDEMGERGIAEPDTIVMDSVLSNPEYLRNVDIDLSSVYNIIIRRNASVKDGDPTFSKQEVALQWDFYPDELVDGLGEHQCSCVKPWIWWKATDDNDTEAIVEIFEEDFDKEYHVYKLVVDGDVDGNMNVLIQDNGFTTFSTYANNPLDYTPRYDASENEYYVVDDGSYDEEEMDIKTIKTVEDGWLEIETEGAPLKLQSSMDYSIDPWLHTLDIGINDNTTGIRTLKANSFSVYPTIFNSTFNIFPGEVTVASIKEITVIDLDGRLLYRGVRSKDDQINLEIALNHGSPGYRLLIIRTEKGKFTKKLLQIK